MQQADGRSLSYAISVSAIYENTVTASYSHRRFTPRQLSITILDRGFLPEERISHSKRSIKIMYFSFSPSPPSTSYSTTPMDIPSSSRTRSASPSCAYPSWPRRSSLDSNDSSTEDQVPVNSYISDDDLLFPCVFDDAESTPLTTPHSIRSPASTAMMPEAQVVVDTGALMRQLIAEEKAKRERKRRGSRSSRKSRSGSSGKPMSPIKEVGE